MDPPALPAAGPAGLGGAPRCRRSSGPGAMASLLRAPDFRAGQALQVQGAPLQGPGRELEERRERRARLPVRSRPEASARREGGRGGEPAGGTALLAEGLPVTGSSPTGPEPPRLPALGPLLGWAPLPPASHSLPSGPPPPLLRELGALRWTRGERDSGAAVPAAPPSPRVASSGARVRPGADGGCAPGVRCCPLTSCRVNPSPPKTQFPH